ncbi:GntR family transcriptional regulator [Nocardioides sp. cx-173]|uniref:GntR family transcriptional regulator n=1 Tax=Nocardioides sp. cx-173 TaxID=2898796 RepID=UPI001E482287|nr:GntR family transcriptional regulator [Nocardioides sp. cx-173]MCD4525014.1 GntR family transcriptional regulator [Nocardioides sp. cx-173]UGB40278.1 GntR family transcriptional regulator [Nocardioides sp. cx-173]
MARSTEKSTLTQEVYDRLRQELLQGDLAPGAKLRITEIAGRYRVSPSVLREALTRLAEQGLIVAMPQRGFAVMELSVADLEDLTRARRLVEVMALRESIADGDLAWESSVLAAHHRLQRTPMTNDDGHAAALWVQAHRDFHHVLLAGGRSARLTDIANGLRDCSTLYIHWSRELARDDLRDVAAEHQEIAELTLARDADRAADALAQHIERTTVALVRYAEARDGQAVASA